MNGFTDEVVSTQLWSQPSTDYVVPNFTEESLQKSVDAVGSQSEAAFKFSLSHAPNVQFHRSLPKILAGTLMTGGKAYRDYLAKTFTSGGLIDFGETGGRNIRIESLDPSISYLTPDISKFGFWLSLPKMFAPTLLHEFVQEVAHYTTGGTAADRTSTQFDEYNVSEGDIAAEELDAGLRRRYIPLRTISTKTDVTVQAALTNNLAPGAKGIQTRAAVISVLRENAHQLIHGDSEKHINQYDGLSLQHYDLSGTTDRYSKGIFTDINDFKNSGLYVDLRGEALSKEEFDNRTATMSTYFGNSDLLLMHPNAISTANTEMNSDTQRWLIPKADGIFGNGFNRLLSPANYQGGTMVVPDQWILPKNYVRYIGDGRSTNTSAPDAPATGLVTAANQNNTASGFTSLYATASSEGVGSRFYAVSAYNAYGESHLTIENATAHAVTANMSVLLTFSSVDADARGYKIYSTVVDGSSDGPYYQIADISKANLVGTTQDGIAKATREWFDYGQTLPNTSDAWLIDKEALAYVYLIPLSVMQLAITQLQTPLTAFMVGALQLKAPTKIIRFANVSLGNTAYNTNRH